MRIQRSALAAIPPVSQDLAEPSSCEAERTSSPSPIGPGVERSAPTSTGGLSGLFSRGFQRAVVAVVLSAQLGLGLPAVGAPLSSVEIDLAAAPRIERVLTRREDLSPRTRAVPSIPSSASKAFREIAQAALGARAQGTIDSRLMVVENSMASETVAIDPQSIFEVMGTLIERAEHDVAFQTFAWASDSDPAQRLFLALRRLSERRERENSADPPVIVRFLIDTMDSGLNGNGPTSQVMRGIERQVRNLDLDPQHVQVQVAAHRHDWLGSLHSKTLVVDGVHSVVTGANANHNDNFETGEHDAGFVFGGLVSRALLSDFDHAWLESEVWTCGTEYPRLKTVKGHPGPRRMDCLRRPESIEHRVAPVPVLPAEASAPMLVLTKPPVNNPFSRDGIDNPLAQALLHALGHGQLIRILTPNLNDRAVVESIVDAVLEGREVQVVMGRGYEDFPQSMPGQGGTNEDVVARMYARLDRAGVTDACDRLKVRWYSHDGRTELRGNVPHALHVKAVWVDDDLVLITSKNMDTQSWRHSREVGVLVDSPVLAKAWLEALFQPDFERSKVVDECSGQSAASRLGAVEPRSRGGK